MRIQITRPRENETIWINRGEDGISLLKGTGIGGFQSTFIHRHRPDPYQEEGAIMDEVHS